MRYISPRLIDDMIEITQGANGVGLEHETDHIKSTDGRHKFETPVVPERGISEAWR